MHSMHIHASMTGTQRLGIIIQAWYSLQRFNLISHRTCSGISYGIALSYIHASFGPWSEIYSSREIIDWRLKWTRSWKLWWWCQQSCTYCCSRLPLLLTFWKSLSTMECYTILSSWNILSINGYRLLWDLTSVLHPSWPMSDVVATPGHQTIQSGALPTTLHSLICSTEVSLYSPSEFMEKGF